MGVLEAKCGSEHQIFILVIISEYDLYFLVGWHWAEIIKKTLNGNIF
jgi:hypothetical protein